jgi:hypothetical protein
LAYTEGRAIFARMFKALLLFLGSAISGAIAIMATTPRGEVMSNLGTYFPALPQAPSWVDPVVTAISVVTASILFGAGVIRVTQPSPIQRLAELRREGVGIRNRPLRSQEEFPGWLEQSQEWRQRAIAAARKASAILAHRLQPLNELYGFPANIVPVNNEHARYLGIMSETLRRIEKYMEGKQ